jgi:16S rRNA (guanine527-N7)-methyltransferase
MTKRRSFLRTVLGTVDRLDVALEAMKGETLAESGREFDVAVSRATLTPPAWLTLGARLVGEPGDVWVFLAKEPTPALAGMTNAESFDYVWPLTSASRRLVRFARAPYAQGP